MPKVLVNETGVFEVNGYEGTIVRRGALSPVNLLPLYYRVRNYPSKAHLKNNKLFIPHKFICFGANVVC